MFNLKQLLTKKNAIIIVYILYIYNLVSEILFYNILCVRATFWLCNASEVTRQKGAVNQTHLCATGSWSRQYVGEDSSHTGENPDGTAERLDQLHGPAVLLHTGCYLHTHIYTYSLQRHSGQWTQHIHKCENVNGFFLLSEEKPKMILIPI